MKKLFTLFAVAAMALTASAQGNYAVSDIQPKDNEAVTSVPNITLTYGTGFKENKASDLGDYTYYTQGVDNVKFDANGVPESGTFYKFEPKLDGKITLGAVIGAGKEFYVMQDGVNLESAGYTLTDKAGTVVTPVDNKLAEKLYGYVAFDVKANSVYYVYMKGSKMSFYGFVYETTGTSDTPVEGETFTLEGVYPSGDFGTIKTPFAIDYDAKTMTFANFLGGDASLVCKYELRDPNANPTMPGTMFNLIPVSGVTEAGDLYGDKIYDFDGLKSSSVIFTKEGVNTIKLNGPQAMFGTYSSVQYKTGGKYEIIVYLSSKNQQWAEGNWGEESPMGYFNLKLTVPASSSQTGIGDVVAGEVDENAPVEYFNLQGVRINEPAAGQIVIRRQGNKVSKIVVR